MPTIELSLALGRKRGRVCFFGDLLEHLAEHRHPLDAVALRPQSEWTTLLGGFLVAGAGVGLLNPVIADVAVSVVPSNQSGMAAGINDTFRQVGVAVGIAAWGAIFIGRGRSEVEELAAGTPGVVGDNSRELVEAASSGSLGDAVAGMPVGVRDTVVTAANEGFLAGLNEVLVLGGLLAFAGAVVSLWLVRENEIEREQAGPELTPELEPAPEPASA